MSEKQIKRPAHEVILSKLRERVEELQNAEDIFDDGFRALGVIAALLDVLGEMIIPEKELEKVYAELIQLADLWSKNIPFPNMLQEIYLVLSNE